MTDKLSAALKEAGNNLRLGQEMAEATAFVMQKRLEVLAGAAADPLRADHVEISLMGAEKVEAFGASAFAAGEALGAIGESCVEIARRNGETAEDNLAALAAEPDDAARLALQTEQIAQFWGQAMFDSIDLWRQALKAQADVMAPLHAAVTANAERLK